MSIKDGDVVRFDYTLYVDGKVHETSKQEIAEGNDLHRETRRYEPLIATLGAGQLVAGLEAHMRHHGQRGEAFTVDVPAAEAFGERDPKRIQMLPMGKFRSKDVDPYVGLRVNLGNERGTVTQIAGGRVRIDTNHELAGKTIRYEYIIHDVIQDEAGKVQAVLDTFFGAGQANATLTADVVLVEVPSRAQFDHGWIPKKYRLTARLRTVTHKTKAVKLVEHFADDYGLMAGHEGHRHGPEGHPNDDENRHHGHDDGHTHGTPRVRHRHSS